MNTFSRSSKLLTSIGIAAVLGLSACGGSNNSGSTSSTAAATTASSGGTVGVATISGSGQVLVDAKGDALYTPDQESSGKILCVGECEAIWKPLMASGSQLTAASGVSGKLGTVKRPDGSTQVTLDGAPLYTFTEDPGPGQATGDGVSDSFGGQSFTWHVVSAGGAAAGSATTPSTTTSSGSGGSGGYGY